MLNGPAQGRFQTLHILTVEATQDMKAATGDKILWPVYHDYIMIVEFGFVMMTADGAVTVAGVYNLDKQIKNGGARAIVNSLAVATFDTAMTVYERKAVALNAGVSTSPATRNYPLANAGDILILELVTQGTGAGAQDVRPYVKFREMPAASVQG